MTIKKIISASLPLFLFPGLIALLSGCMREEIDKCIVECRLTIRAYNASGEELTGADVSAVSLYLFNDNDQLMKGIVIQLGEEIVIERRPGEEIRIVAWGNVTENSLPHTGIYKEECYMGFATYSRADRYMTLTDDLFFGELTLEADQPVEGKELSLYRKTGGMTLTVQNLPITTDEEEYAVIIRETPSRIGFDGRFFGDPVSYTPEGSILLTGRQTSYYVPPFLLLPGEEGLWIDLFRGADLIATIGSDSNGEPIIAREGVLTNVLINLKSTLQVTVTLSPWGKEEIGKEF